MFHSLFVLKNLINVDSVYSFLLNLAASKFLGTNLVMLSSTKGILYLLDFSKKSFIYNTVAILSDSGTLENEIGQYFIVVSNNNKNILKSFTEL